MKNTSVIVVGHEIKSQQHGGFKIVSYYRRPDGSIYKKTKYKNLTITSAEDILYRLDKQLKN